MLIKKTSPYMEFQQQLPYLTIYKFNVYMYASNTYLSSQTNHSEVLIFFFYNRQEHNRRRERCISQYFPPEDVKLPKTKTSSSCSSPSQLWHGSSNPFPSIRCFASTRRCPSYPHHYSPNHLSRRVTNSFSLLLQFPSHHSKATQSPPTEKCWF